MRRCCRWSLILDRHSLDFISLFYSDARSDRRSIQQLAAKQGFPVKSMTSLTTTEEHEETQLLDCSSFSYPLVPLPHDSLTVTQTAESLTTARRSETVPFEELATNIFVMSSQSQAGAPRIEQAIAAGSEEIVTANVCDCGDSSEYGEVICCEGERILRLFRIWRLISLRLS